MKSLTHKTSGSSSARRRKGKRKSVREVEGDVADCEEELEHEEEKERCGFFELCMMWKLIDIDTEIYA